MSDNTTNPSSMSASDPDKIRGVNSKLLIDCNITGASSDIFNVNNMLGAAQNYSAINEIANRLLGYDFKWFRAVPQQRSKDVIFHEYTLSNVDDCPLDIKCIIPSGTVPDSKYSYDLMGLEYEIPFEVQIDKNYWESVAGKGTAPQKKDIVYFPLSNKLYEVESSVLVRGYMEQETTWKINLTKYQPKASRKEGEYLKDTIDKYTVSAEEIFGDAVSNDVDKLVDNKEFSPFNATTEDYYKAYDTDMKVIPNAINIYGTIVAQSYYDMSSVSDNSAIKYNITDAMRINDDRSLLSWVNIMPLKYADKKIMISSIVPLTSKLDIGTLHEHGDDYLLATHEISFSSPVKLSSFSIGDNVTIQRSGALNLFATIVAIDINPVKIYCVINKYVIDELNKMTASWNTLSGYSMIVEPPVTILKGLDLIKNKILSVSIHANQYISVNHGSDHSNLNSYVVRLHEKMNTNQWYGIVVNLGHTWSLGSVHVYKKHETDKNAKLESIFSQSFSIVPQNIAIASYSIDRSLSYLTNIKLFNSTIEEEKHSNELLSYFTKDGDKLILSDLAEPILKIPYISKQK